jgi:hypothetical protein
LIAKEKVVITIISSDVRNSLLLKVFHRSKAATLNVVPTLSQRLGTEMSRSVAHQSFSPELASGVLRDLVVHRYAQSCKLQRTPLGDYQLKQKVTIGKSLS